MISVDTFRIIDANYNRAKEAIRVLEDITRFSLLNKKLTDKYRQLRHKLDKIINGHTTYIALVNSRQTTLDPGKDFYATTHSNIYDIFIANTQRIQEALRTLEEIYKSISIKKSNICMKLRFESYELAKELFAHLKVEQLPQTLLYLVGNAQDWFKSNLYKKILERRLFLVQFRDDSISDFSSYKYLLNFIEYAHKKNTKVIINNRADICLATGADGIHIGKNDLPIHLTRNIVGFNRFIGYTTHTISELKEADTNKDLNYISFGTIFKSPTKPSRPYYGELILSQLKKIKLQKDVVLIGGINLNNVEVILNNGFKKIAVSSAVFKSDNPLHTLDKFLKKLQK